MTVQAQADVGRVIHRIPTYILGPKIFMANEITDRKPWSLEFNNMDPLWLESAGEDITVAVLDTGLWKHADLPEPAFAANFSTSKSVYDSNGHGTHVAGTIGARQNGKGVIGWAPRCNIGCVKVLGDDGSGLSESIAKGIYYAAEQGAKIISMSLGGGYDPMIEQACNDVVQQGVFLICAAGNEGSVKGVNTIGYPGRLDAAIAIGSHNRDGNVSEFSSRGKQVAMSFPGEDILSTWLNGTYRSISGTSMATPAASGLAAVMLSTAAKAAREGKIVKPIRNNRELRDYWAVHAIDKGAPGRDIHYGWGFPDVDGIVKSRISDAAPPVVVPTPTPLPTPGTVPGTPDTGVDLPSFGNFGISLLTNEGRTGLFIYYKN